MAETASNTKKTDKTDASVLPPGGRYLQRHPALLSFSIHQAASVFYAWCARQWRSGQTPAPAQQTPAKQNALSVLRYGKMLVIPLWKH
jgi:hypothetical protein